MTKQLCGWWKRKKDDGSDLSLQGPDGLHPNDSGYEVMAQTWFDVILRLVADTET